MFSKYFTYNLKERKKPHMYILSPTRELTMQIHEELKTWKIQFFTFACVYMVVVLKTN